MPVCNIATGETLYNPLIAVLETQYIVENVIGFASDSASVMVGKINRLSVLSHVITQQPDVFSMGCVCHLAVLCTAAGLKKLRLSINNLFINVYYHFKKRSYLFSSLLFTIFLTDIGNAEKEQVKRVIKVSSNVETKLYCLLASFALKPLNYFNITF